MTALKGTGVRRHDHHQHAVFWASTEPNLLFSTTAFCCSPANLLKTL